MKLESGPSNLLHRAYGQVKGTDENDPFSELLKEVLTYLGVPENIVVEDPTQDALPVMPIIINLNGMKMSWIATIVSFGTPQDVTAEEVMVECLFPSDEQTDQFARLMSAWGGQNI